MNLILNIMNYHLLSLLLKNLINVIRFELPVRDCKNIMHSAYFRGLLVYTPRIENLLNQVNYY